MDHLYEEGFFANKNIQSTNIKLKEKGYVFEIFNIRNMKRFVPEHRVDKVRAMVDVLTKRFEDKQHAKLALLEIQKNLIGLELLNENGGVVVDLNIMLTEDFTWLNEISRNPYVNKGNRRSKPEFMAFFNPNRSSTLEKHLKRNVMVEA